MTTKIKVIAIAELCAIICGCMSGTSQKEVVLSKAKPFPAKCELPTKSEYKTKCTYNPPPPRIFFVSKESEINKFNKAKPVWKPKYDDK